MSEEEARRVSLSWLILEMKLAYYHPEKIHKSWLNDVVRPDKVYDALELEYINLCNKLGHKPTASDMVGFDFDRPSCRLVLERLSKPKGVK
jgi:hypothetical protein